MDSIPDQTCWTLIEGAAEGQIDDRDGFTRRYAAPVRAFFGARWRLHGPTQEIEDALQEVFLECFRHGGVLERVDRERPGGFRAFLYGVARNVALRIETRRARRRDQDTADVDLDLDRIENDETSLSRAFDRAWARTIMREAATLQEHRARERGAEALRRVELLRLHFGEGLPVREIAARWDDDPAVVHREHRRARAEFKEALCEIVGFHHPAPPGEIERECSRLQGLLE